MLSEMPLYDDADRAGKRAGRPVATSSSISVWKTHIVTGKGQHIVIKQTVKPESGSVSAHRSLAYDVLAFACDDVGLPYTLFHSSLTGHFSNGFDIISGQYGRDTSSRSAGLPLLAPERSALLSARWASAPCT